MSATPAEIINPSDAAALTAALDSARTVNFPIGKRYLTRALSIEIDEGRLSTAFIHHCLARHARGDWGDVGEEDRLANERALADGSRIFSVYNASEVEDGRIWIITEAADDGGHREATTIMLPSDY